VRRLGALALAAALAASLASCSNADQHRGRRHHGSRAAAGPTATVTTSTPPTGGTSASGPTTSGATGATSGATGATSGATGATGASRTRFAGRISPLPASLADEMRGTTWRPGCPVPLDQLSLLRMNYWGFDGEIKRGPLVVNASVAEDVLGVFRQLFSEHFPFKRIGLARAFHEKRYDENVDSRRSVTASFNCRVVITPDGPQDTFSQHAYGLAIDVNPLQNPFVGADGSVHDPLARPYADRSLMEPGMIHDGDPIVQAFAAIGWSWGGDWSGDKDYMHFSQSGT
jgi:hypothetical protein